VDRFNLEKAITYAVEAIKAAMLLNGGAAIALLTLVGAVGKGSAGGVQINIGAARWAIFLFGCGMFAAALAFAAGYLAQVEYSEHDKTVASDEAAGCSALARRGEASRRCRRAGHGVSVPVHWRDNGGSVQRKLKRDGLPLA
jgi:hypothetical protein